MPVSGLSISSRSVGVTAALGFVRLQGDLAGPFGEPRHRGVDELELSQERIIDDELQLRRQTEEHLERVEPRLERRLRREQPALAFVQGLASQLDLELVFDPIGVELFLQPREAVAQRRDVRLLILNLNLVLQQAEETAGIDDARGVGRRDVDAAEPAAETGEALQAGPGDAAAAVRTFARRAAGHDLRVEPLPKLFHLPDVVDQLPFDERQPFEHPRPPAEAQQRLHEREVQQRRVRVRVRPRELPDDAVRQIDHELTAGGVELVHLHERIGRRAGSTTRRRCRAGRGRRP